MAGIFSTFMKIWKKKHSVDYVFLSYRKMHHLLQNKEGKRKSQQDHGELTGQLGKFVKYEINYYMLVTARFPCTRYFRFSSFCTQRSSFVRTRTGNL